MIGRRSDRGTAKAVSPVGRWVARFGLAMSLLMVLSGVAAMLPGAGLPSAAVADFGVPGVGTFSGSWTANGTGSAPTRLTFPGLGITTSVVPVGVDDVGNLAIPDNPQLLGWWQDGAAPGGGAGATVIDGHLDSYQYGIGFLVNLRRLQPGDQVVLDGNSGARTDWTVTSATLYPRDALPADQLFSRNGPPRLVLITCGGVFDRISRSYSDNLVVTAFPGVRGPQVGAG
jgi:hypothetical protein